MKSTFQWILFSFNWISLVRVITEIRKLVRIQNIIVTKNASDVYPLESRVFSDIVGVLEPKNCELIRSYVLNFVISR